MLDPQHTAFLRHELFYKYLIDSVEDYAIFSTDLQGSISTWNRGAKVIMGYSPAERIWFEREEGKGSVFYFTLTLQTGMQRPDFEKRLLQYLFLFAQRDIVLCTL